LRTWAALQQIDSVHWPIGQGAKVRDLLSPAANKIGAFFAINFAEVNTV